MDLTILDKRHTEASTDFSGGRDRLRWYWKGNHNECSHALGTCIATAGWVNHASGAVIPSLANFPIGKRHQMTIEEEGPNASGEIVMGHKAKGFVPLDIAVFGMREQQKQKDGIVAEIVAKVRPDDEILSSLRALRERELRTTSYEEKHTTERTEKDLETVLAKFDKANAKPSAAPAPKQGAARG